MSGQMTPGPWRYMAGRVEAYTDGNPGIVVHEPIADVSIAYKDSETRDANARAIAAVPDLIEALKKIARGEIEEFDPDVEQFVTTAMHAEEAAEIARAALEKAGQ